LIQVEVFCFGLEFVFQNLRLNIFHSVNLENFHEKCNNIGRKHAIAPTKTPLPLKEESVGTPSKTPTATKNFV
jgi:hypothetical protein